MFGWGKKEREAEEAQKAKDERRRIKECGEAVAFLSAFFGYIGRECISRNQIAILIEEGITPEQLVGVVKGLIEKKEAMVLGSQYVGDAAFPVKLTDYYRERHVYAIGRSGSGKTNMLRGMILQDIAAGNGVAVLAPEQELITDELLPFIPEDRVDDVIYVNPADSAYPIPFNPLHLDAGEDIDLKVDETVTIFKRIMGETGVRMDEILRQSLYALMEREGSTLLDIERLLNNQDGFRDQIIKTTNDPQTARFFKNTLQSYPKGATIPITTRISRFIRPRNIRAMLCQPGRNLNFREAMDEGKILLFNVSDGILGEQTAELLGQLIVSKIQLAVMSRADTPAYARRPFYLYLDEFQTFTGVAGASYEKLLSRARKYKMGLILAHQQTGQITGELLREILGNVSTLISFAVSHADATKFSHEFRIRGEEGEEELDPGELIGLRTGEAFAKIGTTSFFMRTNLFNQKPDYTRAKEIIERSRLNYGIPAMQVSSSRKSGSLKLPPKDIDDDDSDPAEVF